MINGKEIQVIKRKHFRGHEELWNNNIVELFKQDNKVRQLYRELNFNTVKASYETHANDLAYEQIRTLNKALESYPDIQRILEEGDFEESAMQIFKDKLSITKPKVRVTCKLPYALEEGYCEFEFASILLRNLKVRLDHKSILEKLMTGLGTPPNQETRHFIKKQNGIYKVALDDKFSLVLSEEETRDLCSCVDAMAFEYKTRMIKTDSAFRAQGFPYGYSKTWDCWGFPMLTVRKDLWRLMMKFACEFDYENGKSEWHIFDKTGSKSIRISQGINDHAIIYPEHEEGCNDDPLGEYVRAFYYLNPDYGSIKDTSWIDNFGKNGFWTVPATKKWMEEEFIPKVAKCFPEEYKEIVDRKYNPIVYGHFSNIDLTRDMASNLVWSDEINDAKDLIPFLRAVQQEFRGTEQIEASLVKDYYEKFVDLVENFTPPVRTRQKQAKPRSLVLPETNFPDFLPDLSDFSEDEEAEYIDIAIVRTLFGKTPSFRGFIPVDKSDLSI